MQPPKDVVFEWLDHMGAGNMDDTEAVDELVVDYDVDPGYALECVREWREEYEEDTEVRGVCEVCGSPDVNTCEGDPARCAYHEE